MPGLRFTSPSATLSVDVEAYTDTKPLALGGEGGIHYVQFDVKNSGGTIVATYRKVSTELRTPNYSAAPSPLPGAVSGGMGLIVAYGITLTMSGLPAGKVIVSAKVVSQKATETTLPDFWLWNDSDGTDRRGSTKTIYVNASTGNNANAGTIGAPVQTIVRALELVVANPAGTGLTNRHAGGGTIICTGDFVGNGAFSSVAWHTDDQWLTIIATPGTTWREGTTNFFPCPGVDNAGTLRVRFVGWTVYDNGQRFFLGSYPSTTAQLFAWWDGLTMQPLDYSESRPWDIRYGHGEPTVRDGPNPTRIQSFLTCCTFKGRGASFGHNGAHDVLVRNYIAIAWQTNSDQPSSWICNTLVERQRYVTADIHGLWHTRGTNLVVSVPSAGTMRVTQVGPCILLANAGTPTNAPGDPLLELDVQLAAMPGYTAWVYRFSGCANAGNNGDFACTAVGRDGLGRPYADFANASAVAETLSSTARIVPARPGGQDYYGAVHPDLIQHNAPGTQIMVTHFAARDINNSQGHFVGGHAMTRMVMAFCTDGGQITRMDGCTLTDCVVSHNSLTAPWSFNSTTMTGCSVEENVFQGGVVGSGPNVSTNWWRGNHFGTGSAYVS